MLEIKVTIETPGLTAALETLAAALLDHKAPDAAPEVHREEKKTVEPQAVPAAAAMPVSVPVAAPPSAPAPAAADTQSLRSAPTPVPTSPAPFYTVEQIQKAGGDMIAADPGKMAELMALLQQFGVPAVTELKPEQLGPFATALRQMGGKL